MPVLSEFDHPADSAENADHDDPSSPPIVPPNALEEAIGKQEFQPLALSYVLFERRTGYIATLVLGLLLVVTSSPAVVYSLVTNRIWLAALIVVGWLAAGLLLGFSAHFWPPVKYRHIAWRLDDNGLEIHRGVWWRHRIAVPVARVQHVDVSQGPIQRMFDLGTLTVYTAGTKNSSVELEGLEHGLAMKLRDQLILQKESLDVL